MNKSLVVRTSVLALLLSTSAIYAQTTAETRSVSASVSGALTGDTGFLTGGQVQVQGVGQGSVVLTSNNASVLVRGGASGGIDPDTGLPGSQSKMMTGFAFDRSVDTRAALVGVGNVVAQGESLGGVAVVGTTSANATRSGTGENGDGDPMAGAATSPTTAAGSLVGQFSTTNTMQMLGQGSLFAGGQQLRVGELNEGISAGMTGDVVAGVDQVNLDSLVLSEAGEGDATPTATGAGAGFAMWRELTNGDTIDLNVGNAGQGSVLVSAATGGFFGQGTAFGATALPTFSETNGFFTNP